MALTNVEYNVTGSTLKIEVDLNQDFGLSSTGKSTKIATTHGFLELDDAPGAIFSLNVNRKFNGG